MKSDGDALRMLAWGLRRYAWLVVLSVVAFGVLVPVLVERAPDQYDAQAQVGPVEPLALPNPDLLPKSVESIFSNGAVAAEIRTMFEPQLSPSASVIPNRVELVAPQDNVILTVIGHGATPATAERIANRAAARFTAELNKYSRPIGVFAVQRSASAPARPNPQVGGTLPIALGLLGGLVFGIGAVALLLVWRRPVVEVGGAEEATGAPLYARVQLGSSDGDVRGLPQLCRRLLDSPVDVLLLAGPSRYRRERRQLATALTDVLARARPVTVVRGGEFDPRDYGDGHLAPGNAPGRRELVIVDGPTQAEVATRPDASLTLLVVREGTSYSSLRGQAENYLDEGAAGVVLIRGSRLHPRNWLQRLRSPRPSKRQRTVAASASD